MQVECRQRGGRAPDVVAEGGRVCVVAGVGGGMIAANTIPARFGSCERCCGGEGARLERSWGLARTRGRRGAEVAGEKEGDLRSS